MSSSPVDSAMRGSSISFLTRASVAWLDSCLKSFLCILARCHESKGITGQFGTHWQFQNCLHIPSSFEQSGPICERSISSVKQRAAFHTVGGLDYRRRTVSEDRRREKGRETKIFTVSLNGANILSTPIQSPMSCKDNLSHQEGAALGATRAASSRHQLERRSQRQ